MFLRASVCLSVRWITQKCYKRILAIFGWVPQKPIAYILVPGIF